MSSSERPPGQGSRILVLPLIALAVVVATLAVPRIGAGFARIPGNTAISFVQSGYTLSRDGFERVVRSREQALAWTGGDPDSYKELGLVYLAMAQGLTSEEGWSGNDAEPSFLQDGEEPGSDPEISGTRSGRRSAGLDRILRDVDELLRSGDRVVTDGDREFALDVARRSVALLSEGLGVAPADPIHWMFLGIAYAEVEDAAGVARALEGSHAAGAFNPEVAFLRARLALAYWDALDGRAREHARRDFVLAMKRDSKEFVAAAREAGRLLEAREALELGLDHELLDRFEILTAGPASTS